MKNASRSYIFPPLKPTWRRYWKIFISNSNLSIYRALEYEALSHIKYSGRLLDFGGGNNAHYVDNIKALLNNGIYESINMDTKIQPTFHVERGGLFPIHSNVYDMVLSLNTLEHVYEINIALSEIVRVLKPGGKIVFGIPFLFRGHGSPDDFNRPTPSWWYETLVPLGISELQITPLVWDIMVTGLSITEYSGPLRSVRRILIPLYGLLYSKFKAGGSTDRYPYAMSAALSDFALGYIISGTKTS